VELQLRPETTLSFPTDPLSVSDYPSHCYFLVLISDSWQRILVGDRLSCLKFSMLSLGEN